MIMGGGKEEEDFLHGDSSPGGEQYSTCWVSEGDGY